MARFKAYYTLCPLIDQQNLLGVRKDVDIGCAVVTLGRNIVIRYKLQDLKQISSWSSKERLTSEVIYDTTIKKYVAVFNEKVVKLWSADETSFDNVKKYKFSTPLNKILTLDGTPPILVSQNGATISLQWVLDKKNRQAWKSKGFLQKNEQLLECQLIDINHNIYLCASTKYNEYYNYVFVPLKSEIYTEDIDSLKRIELKRSSETLVGHTVIYDKNKAYLLSLWSNGMLYNCPINFASNDVSPEVPVCVIKTVNTNHPVMMVPLNESTIAMYGADSAEEGAVIAIYNVQFKLIQAIQKLKLYTTDANLWNIDDFLLLAANRHLAVTSFNLAAQKIEAMIGSSLNLDHLNKSIIKNEDIVIIQESITENWNNSEKVGKKISKLSQLPFGLSNSIGKKIRNCINEGLDDADIQLLIMDDLIQNKDVVSIKWCLNNFKDLPEKVLLNLLLFGLRTEDQVFKPVQNGHSHDKINSETLNCRNEFLNQIFNFSNPDMYFLGYLKTSLKFDEVLRLLDYLTEQMKDDKKEIENISNVPNYKQLYEWTSLVLDSHYQQCLLSQDPIVLQKLNQLKETLEMHSLLLKDLENLRPMLRRVMDGQSLKITSRDIGKLYTIKNIKLY